MSSETVECPKCDARFELWESGGFCTNPDCGTMHPKARQQSDGATDSADADTEEASSESGSSDGVSVDNDGAVASESGQVEAGGADGMADADAAGTVDNDAETARDSGKPVDSGAQCPDCGEEVSPDAAFCQYCGTELETEDEPEPVQPTSCPECGAGVEPDQNFCMECGAELEPVPPESEHAPESGSPAGSQPDTRAAADASGGSSDDEPTPTVTGANQPSTEQTMDDADGGGMSGLPQIELEIEGERFEVYDGDMVGSKFRRAFINAGGDRDDARYIHREHIEVDVRDDGVYLIDHGENATKVGGTRLETGDEQQVEDGDTIELGNVAEAEARIS